MGYKKIGKLGDVPSGTAKVYTVCDRDIAVCNVDGKVYAIDDICTHDGASLDQGHLEDFEIECPRHGARFDVRSGEATEKPAVLPVDTFDIRLSGNDIELKI